MSVNNKRVFYVKYLSHQVYADILKARADVRLDRLENESPEQVFAPVLAAAHAYQIGAARDELAPHFHVHADLLRRLQGAIPEGALVLQVETPPEIVRDYGIAPADAAPIAGVPLWSDWLAGFPPREEAGIPVPGSMIYTSGTTGRPKGVRRQPPKPEQTVGTQDMLNAVCGFQPWIDRPEEMRVLLSGPIYHSTPNAWLGVFHGLGANIFVAAKFDPEQMLANVERHRITHLLAVPTNWPAESSWASMSASEYGWLLIQKRSWRLTSVLMP